jgi:hypothetical protein
MSTGRKTLEEQILEDFKELLEEDEDEGFEEDYVLAEGISCNTKKKPIKPSDMPVGTYLVIEGTYYQLTTKREHSFSEIDEDEYWR